jgi:hypothetical protein
VLDTSASKFVSLSVTMLSVITSLPGLSPLSEPA